MNAQEKYDEIKSILRSDRMDWQDRLADRWNAMLAVPPTAKPTEPAPPPKLIFRIRPVDQKPMQIRFLEGENVFAEFWVEGPTIEVFRMYESDGRMRMEKIADLRAIPEEGK